MVPVGTSPIKSNIKSDVMSLKQVEKLKTNDKNLFFFWKSSWLQIVSKKNICMVFKIYRYHKVYHIRGDHPVYIDRYLLHIVAQHVRAHIIIYIYRYTMRAWSRRWPSSDIVNDTHVAYSSRRYTCYRFNIIFVYLYVQVIISYPGMRSVYLLSSSLVCRLRHRDESIY